MAKPTPRRVTVYFEVTTRHSAQIDLDELTELALKDGEFRAPALDDLVGKPYLEIRDASPGGVNEPGDTLSEWLREQAEAGEGSVTLTEITGP
jgi:hypothetical protein